MNQLLHIIWDPSIGIQIGNFTLRYYSLMYVIAFSIGFYLMSKIFKKDNEDQKLLDPLFIYMFLAVIIGARLGHVLFYQKELFIEDPLAVFLPFRTKPEFQFTGFSGLASHGAAIGIVISLYFYNKKYLKRNLLWILDRIVIPVAIGGMFVRLGNFFNSEILGKPSDLPWSVLFNQQDVHEYGERVSRHPAQLYEAFGYLILFFSLVFIYFKTNKKKFLGWIFGYFLIILFGIRFIVEFFKEPQGEEYINWFGLNTGQWLSIPFILVGIYILLTSKNRIYITK
ncbi:prolipoprotein diacylglyceryl transferase [Apibacter muscae]|uniref:prolipoprotein diacylglyceryl transferase n=1 Tax=Apibacter muscae TaxID=2509004 RepID=UPI0011AD3F0C|nr:prolipoprotein diacylglyceryl transferase [Apibacter muscae]TWP30871.1 prolipoprotein diacylglyceryl transferase [Apibacter muscae]